MIVLGPLEGLVVPNEIIVMEENPPEFTKLIPLIDHPRNLFSKEEFRPIVAFYQGVIDNPKPSNGFQFINLLIIRYDMTDRNAKENA